MTLGSLFAGIGGFELAATWAGIKPVWSNEINAVACNRLRNRFEHEIIEKDVKKITKRDLNSVDIISAGVPCQPASVAGKRKGTKDDRWLWPEAIRIVSELKPAYVICENPTGILTLEDGKPFQQVLYALENEGYLIELYNIPACSVGAWHRRESIWIIAYSHNHSNERGLDNREDPGTPKRGKGKDKQQARGVKNRKRIRVVSNERLETITDINSERLERKNQPEKSIRFNKRDSRHDRPGREIEPELVRLVHGIPNRMERITGLGNAIDPYVAYEIFKAITEIQNK